MYAVIALIITSNTPHKLTTHHQSATSTSASASSIMSPPYHITKQCRYHKNKVPKILRRLCATIVVFAFIVLVIFLIILAILQPKKPHFLLQDATLYAFNLTSIPNLLTSNFQVTISSRNPNGKIGIYYDKLDIYATYRSQQITYYTAMPPTYQSHKTFTVWSPFISGTNVPVAPYYGEALDKDQASGAIWVAIKINGRLRWKVGTFVTGTYRLHVTCPAYIPFGNKDNGAMVEDNIGVKYQLSKNCKVSV